MAAIALSEKKICYPCYTLVTTKTISPRTTLEGKPAVAAALSNND
jgi:hypothetical protein